MWNILNANCKISLNSDEFSTLLFHLNKGVFKSAVWQSKIALLSHLGITKIDKKIQKWVGFHYEGKSAFIFDADVIWFENAIYYIVNFRRDNIIEIGVVSQNKTEMKSLLTTFAREVVTSIKKAVDGRKLRHIKINWYKVAENSLISTHVTFYKTFKFPDFSTNQIASSFLLTNTHVRKFLHDLSKGKSSGSPIVPVPNSIEKKQIHDLLAIGVLEENIIITCKKSNKSISSFAGTRNDLKANKLKCTTCGRLFQDEKLQEVVDITPAGLELINNSLWLSIFIYDILVRHGIEKKSIILQAYQGPEEVDMIVQVKESVWVFELKDRDFELGDAQRFAHRASKFKADHGIIITTGRVSKQAKSVFSDMDVHNVFSKKKWNPFYIEGVQSIEESLIQLLKNEELSYLLSKYKQITGASTIGYDTLFQRIFGKIKFVNKGEFVDY